MSRYMSEPEQRVLIIDDDPERVRLLHLIAQVIAWSDGGTDLQDIADEARGVIWLDHAQQCAEDLGLA